MGLGRGSDPRVSGQIGTVLGVSILVIVLAAAGSAGPVHAFAVARWISVGVLAVSALAALGITPRRREAAGIGQVRRSAP